jgi:hypothetical protein
MMVERSMRTEIERELDAMRQDRDVWRLRAEQAQAQLDDCRAALAGSRRHHEDWVDETNTRIEELQGEGRFRRFVQNLGRRTAGESPDTSGLTQDEAGLVIILHGLQVRASKLEARTAQLEEERKTVNLAAIDAIEVNVCGLLDLYHGRTSANNSLTQELAGLIKDYGLEHHATCSSTTQKGGQCDCGLSVRLAALDGREGGKG